MPQRNATGVIARVTTRASPHSPRLFGTTESGASHGAGRRSELPCSVAIHTMPSTGSLSGGLLKLAGLSGLTVFRGDATSGNRSSRMPRREVRCLHSLEPLVVQDRCEVGQTSSPSTLYPFHSAGDSWPRHSRFTRSNKTFTTTTRPARKEITSRKRTCGRAPVASHCATVARSWRKVECRRARRANTADHPPTRPTCGPNERRNRWRAIGTSLGRCGGRLPL